MKIKADWLPLLHDLRTREIERVFEGCPEGTFDNALEIGAGDGYQSKLLISYAKKLVCTEFDDLKLVRSRDPQISYRICDAEKLDEHFKPASFDLIFSSNLMEHLNHPEKTLCDCHAILADDGVMIHIMPGPFVKICWLALFYPNQLITLIEELTKKKGSASAVFKMAQGEKESIQTVRPDLGNNPKQAGRTWLAAQFWPQTHGAYPSHLKELLAYRPLRWKKELEKAGFEVNGIIRLPATSGYGFGLKRLRRIFEKLGFGYGFAYVATKQGSKSKKARPFMANRYRLP